MKKRIMVVDGQGGGVGRSLAEALLERLPQAEILVVGANGAATSNMMKAGNILGATGENAVVFNSGRVDVIAGPVGIVMANAMLGEITPKMAEAIASSEAALFLIPMNKCHVTVVGVENKRLTEYIKEVVDKIAELD